MERGVEERRKKERASERDTENIYKKGMGEGEEGERARESLRGF